MEIWLVADTNLFFEFKLLDQLPWEELGHDPVIVLLTKPVLDEIDKHKKGSGRTRDRALEIYGRVRTMLTTGTNEVELRPSAPRVILRLDNTRPDPALKEDLDYGRVDEKLVGIVSALKYRAQGCVVELFTDDAGPASTANGFGVPFRMIDGSWRRPASESTEAKKIKELEKDLATYRAQEPKIEIAGCEGAAQPNIVEVVRRVAEPLTTAEIGEILASLCAKHPKKTDFTPPSASTVTKADGEIVHTEWTAPLDAELAEYESTLYPQWIEQCRGVLVTLHEGRDVPEPELTIRWPMSNVGTRPALQVRVEFEAHGPLTLLRPPQREDDESELDEVKPVRPALVSRFPLPPKPPIFRENVTRTPAPARANPLAASRGVSSAVASDILRQNRGVLASSLDGLQRASMVPTSRYLASNSAMGEAGRLFGDSSILGRALGSGAFATATPIMPLSLRRMPPLPPRHEPEAFYWDWPEDEPVKKGALTCDLWRHGIAEEMFTFSVEFERDDVTRGSIVCTVHAQNLTKPEQSRVVVGRSIERFNVKDIAEEMVDACS